jgi:hypothetical protein
MKLSFLRIGVISVSLLSASLFSFKLFELHIHFYPDSEARTGDNGPPAVPADAPERINFRRGALGETVQGVVDRGKSYVLRANTGQSLSASVSSSNHCVVFQSGSTTVNFTTVAGDNSLAVVNSCGGQSDFRLAVDIR